jgi:protein-disulfide isomerase
VHRAFVALLLLCVGCSAQSNISADLNTRIERRLRARFQIPDQVSIKLGVRKPSEFPNYDAFMVTIGEKGQEELYLISKDDKTLVQFNKMDITKDPYAEVMSRINLDQRPWRGKVNAKVVIVNYDDFECPYCSRLHQGLFGDLYRTYADKVKIVYKDYPLSSIHPWAERAAIDSVCLANLSSDAYWSFADYMHANGQDVNQKPPADQFEAVDKIARDQGKKFNVNQDQLGACLKKQDDSAVKDSVAEGDSLGVDGTPTLFVNGHRVSGPSMQELRRTIDRALAEAGEPVPPSPPAGPASAPTPAK